MCGGEKENEEKNLRSVIQKTVIIEKYPLSGETQKKLVAGYAGLLEWQTELGRVKPFCGCILSNELIDGFPVHLLKMGEPNREIYGVACQMGFVEIDGELSMDDLRVYTDRYLLPRIPGCRTAVNLRIKDYLTHPNRMLSEGVAITIDNGYGTRDNYDPDRRTGTLLSYSHH